eukprot:TRINITY_DN40693_c0_g1_i1.p1 TRINITY_DN40693_c0_g1~~TRINITY_DN40693_c0_g1_i1.p1  ORF type:complete len:798 (-),score=154.24 TRINITY_DN40693_c0_g1_i1:358-2751(-)
MRSPRLSPPTTTAFSASFDVFGASNGWPTNKEELIEKDLTNTGATASPQPLDLLRHEAESLAKIRRDVAGQRSTKPRRRTSSSATSLRAAGAKRLLLAQQRHSADSQPPVSSELSTSVVPKFERQRFRQTMGQTSLTSSPSSMVHSAGASPPDPATGRPLQQTQCTPHSNVAGVEIAAGCVERQHLERRQLIEWGENLLKVVGDLEREKSQVEMQLSASVAERARLERELEHSQRRCSDLEAILGEGSAYYGTSERIENYDLRKQLSAYAVEIQVLREESENEQHNLEKANAEVKRLTEECKVLVRSMQELEHTQSNLAGHCFHLEGKLSDQSEKKTHVEDQLRNAISELTVVGTSLEIAKERDLCERKVAEQALEEAEQSVSDKDTKIAELIDIIQPLQKELVLMQDDFVKQTRDFNAFVQRVKAQQVGSQVAMKSLGRCLQASWEDTQELPHLLEELSQASAGVEKGQRHVLGEWRRSQTDLQLEIERRTEEQRLSQDELKLLRDKEEARRLARKVRLSKMHKPLIVGQMKQACLEGVVLQKVNEKGTKQAQRKLIVCQDTMRLKWVKSPFNFGRHESFVELRSLIHLAYGCMARAFVRFPKQCDPLHCFSVYTADRSYDFICQDKWEAEAFVLSISRLYARICGWRVPGSIQTHANFVRATAWSKVERKCREEKKPMAALLTQAVAMASAKSSARVASEKPKVSETRPLPKRAVSFDSEPSVSQSSTAAKNFRSAPPRSGSDSKLGRVAQKGKTNLQSTAAAEGIHPSVDSVDGDTSMKRSSHGLDRYMRSGAR